MLKANDVVIAAMDLLSAYGAGVDACWEGLMEGRHAFSCVRRFQNEKFHSLLAGTVPEGLLDPQKPIPEQFLDYLSKCASLFPEDALLMLASTLGEIERLENPEGRCTSDSLLEKALKRFGKKRGMVVSAACASSNSAIARAGAMIRAGRLDYALIAGCDYVSEFVFSGFATLRAMTETPSRPYDQNRTGLILGDSAGILGLTSAQKAQENGWDVLAKISGWGMTCDAVHITAPMESGEMLAEAVWKALAQAGLKAEDIGAVIGHGTGTKYNDAMEINALNILYKGLPKKPLISVKGGCGHTLAGAGIVQAAVAVKMLQTGLIPPQTSLETPGEGAEEMLSKEVRRLSVPRILTMNSGFGGLNAVLILEEAK